MRRSFNIQRRRQGYPGQFRELDRMKATPTPRKQPNKAKPDREADPRAKTRAQGSESRAQRGESRGRGRDTPICPRNGDTPIGPKRRAKRRVVAEIRKSRLPGATYKIRKSPLAPPIEPNQTPKSYLKKNDCPACRYLYV